MMVDTGWRSQAGHKLETRAPWLSLCEITVSVKTWKETYRCVWLWYLETQLDTEIIVHIFSHLYIFKYLTQEILLAKYWSCNLTEGMIHPSIGPTSSVNCTGMINILDPGIQLIFSAFRNYKTISSMFSCNLKTLFESGILPVTLKCFSNSC